MPNSLRIDAARQEGLLAQLIFACRQTPTAELAGWSKESALLFFRVLARRAKNLGSVAVGIAKWVGEEAIRAGRAVGSGTSVTYTRQAGDRAAAGTATVINATHALGRTVIDAFTVNPAEKAPQLLVGALAAFAASGGPDANGGAPDIDLAFGIDAHRSLLTHSVLSGAVIETSLIALADLVDIVHRNLPPDHDQLWDRIRAGKAEFVRAAHRGASAGIAYHLGIDATVQEGSYHGLGVPLSQEGHDLLAGANAAAEGIDAAKRGPLASSVPPLVSKEQVKEVVGGLAAQSAQYARYGTAVAGGFLKGLFGVQPKKS